MRHAPGLGLLAANRRRTYGIGMDYRLDYTRPMTAADFRTWQAHVRYNVKKAARLLHVTPQDIAAFEFGTKPIDAIAQDCCRIAEIVEHRRAERRRAAKDEPPFDPDAEPPIDPDGLDPRRYALDYVVDVEREMTAADMRALREHIGYTLYQLAAALHGEPTERILRYESGEVPIPQMIRDWCSRAEVWEWRKAQRRVWKNYWRRRGEPPPAPPPPMLNTPEYMNRISRQMSAEDFRLWQARRGWTDALVALHLGTTEDLVREYRNGQRPIDVITGIACWSADAPPLPPPRRPPWRR